MSAPCRPTSRLLIGTACLSLLLSLGGCASTRVIDRPVAVPCPQPPEELLQPIQVPPAVRAPASSGGGLSG